MFTFFVCVYAYLMLAVLKMMNSDIFTDQGCFDSCSKTCHCSEGAADCNTVTGECFSSKCLHGWTGHNCQTGNRFQPIFIKILTILSLYILSTGSRFLKLHHNISYLSFLIVLRFKSWTYRTLYIEFEFVIALKACTLLSWYFVKKKNPLVSILLYSII